MKGCIKCTAWTHGTESCDRRRPDVVCQETLPSDAACMSSGEADDLQYKTSEGNPGGSKTLYGFTCRGAGEPGGC